MALSIKTSHLKPAFSGLARAIDAWFEFKSIVVLSSIDSIYHNVVCILNNNAFPYGFSGILILVS
jgi:hypothetical protein